MLILADVLILVTRKETNRAIVGTRSQDLKDRQKGKGAGNFREKKRGHKPMLAHRRFPNNYSSQLPLTQLNNHY